MRSPVCAVILSLSISVCAHARDIFVDNVGGDDQRPGVSASANTLGGGPVRTISRALHLAQPGDVIILAPNDDPYRECLTLQGFRHSGSPERPFQIIGNGAVLEGAFPIPPDAWEHVDGDIHRFRPKRTSHQQLFLDSIPLERVAVENNELRLPALAPLQWCLYERAMYVNFAKPTTANYKRVREDVLNRAVQEGWRYSPADYDLTYAGHPVGISLYNVRNVVITDLFVQGFQLDGINAHDLALNVSLVGVNCRGNGRSGVTVGGASRVRIVESILGNNGAAQLRAEGYSRTVVTGSEIIANTAPAVVRDGGEVVVNGLPLKSRKLDEDILPAHDVAAE